LKTQHWDGLPGPVQEIIDRIQVRAHTLSERIRDILILGDLRSESVRKNEVAPIGIDSLIRQVVDDLAEKAASRKLSVAMKIDALSVHSDAKQLMTLFSNLIANAIYYSPEGGSIEISTIEADDGTHVSIADHGIGISEKAMPLIFDEYYRTPEGAQFNKQSTGLGLSIVKQISINLGLRIRVESTLGKGSTFAVTIPHKTGVSNQPEEIGVWQRSGSSMMTWNK
jgi:signal transduction histidine kinase